mmetsp:Transcript_23859/g.46381  ORF Transcript_23859/g.46381 Transcript_23859/m.46381 type:complete len:410 (+) Transcript_23859:19-1248(+)
MEGPMLLRHINGRTCRVAAVGAIFGVFLANCLVALSARLELSWNRSSPNVAVALHQRTQRPCNPSEVASSPLPLCPPDLEAVAGISSEAMNDPTNGDATKKASNVDNGEAIIKLRFKRKSLEKELDTESQHIRDDRRSRLRKQEARLEQMPKAANRKAGVAAVPKKAPSPKFDQPAAATQPASPVLVGQAQAQAQGLQEVVTETTTTQPATSTSTVTPVKRETTSTDQVLKEESALPPYSRTSSKTTTKGAVVTTKKATTASTSTTTTMATTSSPITTSTRMTTRKTLPNGASCADAVKGEPCYKHVMWAKKHGIHEHPEWYPGVNQHSSFSAFQIVLHDSGKGNCAIPCTGVPALHSTSRQPLLIGSKECHTAIPGEKCYKETLWAKHQGIYSHPSWYPGYAKCCRRG